MNENLMSILDMLIDERCELFGIKNTICWLLDAGLTEDELIELHFDEEDIKYVLANPDDEYDCE